MLILIRVLIVTKNDGIASINSSEECKEKCVDMGNEKEVGCVAIPTNEKARPVLYNID